MAEIASGPEAIAEAVRRLLGGRLVAFPTETVYGLGADALSAEAVEKVFALKGRPAGNPLIVHVAGVEMARAVTADWPEAAGRIADAFWPGPVTIVLPKGDCVPDAVTAGGPTVAVRCPAHPCALALIEAVGRPIVGPSANPSGFISPTTPEHVHDAFADEDLLVIDGGHCRAGIESTVVDLTTGTPRILRPGIVGPHAIAKALGRSVEALDSDPRTDRARSPGVIGAHYQPRTTTRLIKSSDLERAPSSAILVAWSVGAHPSGGTLIAMPETIGAYAAAMYRALHEADRSPGTEIWVEPPPEGASEDDRAIREAVMERLGRAAHA
ncbi:MAG: L-threonylcarbamoyladenylate synthase [Phycisphaerales bacterium]